MNNLRTGMVVILRNGEKCIVLHDRSILLYISKYSTNIALEDYNSDMTHKYNNDYDIIKVYQPFYIGFLLRDIVECAYFDYTMKSFELDEDYYDLLYDRDCNDKDKIIKMLTDMGVTFMDNKGNNRSAVDVICELNNKWKKVREVRHERDI